MVIVLCKAFRCCWPRLTQTLVLLFVLFGSTACSAQPGEPPLASANVIESLSGEASPDLARAYEPVEFVFPDDHGAHLDYGTEWWYFTGNLVDESGNDFGYQLTFFRSALEPGESERPSEFATNHIYMAHFAVTSEAADRHLSYDRFSRGAGGLAGVDPDVPFGIFLEDWRVESTEPGRFRLLASAGTENDYAAIDLILEESGEPLLHGNQGLSQKGPEAGNASYYYSLVKMGSLGTIRFGEDRFQVQGQSWMDHEYSTSALSGDAVGWDWFSVTLENGVVLMFAQIRSRSGEPQDIFEGTLAFPDGRQFIIRQEDFELEALAEWTSPRTGITYPSGWRVLLPEYEIQLEIDPIVEDQEMNVAFLYYEGATRVTGSLEGSPVSGVGYVELTGYGDNEGYQSVLNRAGGASQP